MSTDQQLEWEARQRGRAGLAAILAGLLTLGAGIYTGTGFGDIPRAHLLEALELVAQPGPIGGAPSLRVGLYEYYQDNTGKFMIAAIINALGTLAVGGALTYLAFATRARREQFPRIGVYVGFVGATLFAVGVLLYAVGTSSTVDTLLDGPRTVDAIADIQGDSVLVAGQLIEVVGRFALGSAYVLVCLNAMRTGLLTRFMGVLGILVGVLLVVPLLQGPPVVQSFWLFALGALFLGFSPRGVPPAWSTGQAEPWPSNAQLRAARAGEPAADSSDPRDEPPSIQRRPPGGNKRKRKRRT